MLVRSPHICKILSAHVRPDGGWLKSHPIPSDKGAFGNFEALAQENRRVLQQILSSESSYSVSTASTSYDQQILKKLREFYNSCMDESKLAELGTEPLASVTSRVRRLLKGETTVVDTTVKEKHSNKNGLTAAIAYLHSRGSLLISCVYTLLHDVQASMACSQWTLKGMWVLTQTS